MSGIRVGVDISPGLLAVARRALPSAGWIRADAAWLPIADSSMDLLTCVAGISYLRPAAVLPEWRRVLRPTGRLLVTLPADRGLMAFTLLQDAAKSAGVTLPEPNAGLGSRSKLERTGARHGLVLRDVTEATYHEPLAGEAADAFGHYLDQGLAEPLRRAAPTTQQHALEAYRESYREAADAGLGSQRLLFASWTVS